MLQVHVSEASYFSRKPPKTSATLSPTSSVTGGMARSIGPRRLRSVPCVPTTSSSRKPSISERWPLLSEGGACGRGVLFRTLANLGVPFRAAPSLRPSLSLLRMTSARDDMIAACTALRMRRMENLEQLSTTRRCGRRDATAPYYFRISRKVDLQPYFDLDMSGLEIQRLSRETVRTERSRYGILRGSPPRQSNCASYSFQAVTN